jgi:hypothetical protein
MTSYKKYFRGELLVVDLQKHILFSTVKTSVFTVTCISMFHLFLENLAQGLFLSTEAIYLQLRGSEGMWRKDRFVISADARQDLSSFSPSLRRPNHISTFKDTSHIIVSENISHLLKQVRLLY